MIYRSDFSKRTARKLLSETAMELNLGRHYTGRELEDN